MKPPIAFAEVVGAVKERDLLEKAFRDDAILDRPVGEVMGPPLPSVGIGESIDQAVEALERGPAVLIVDGGHPVGIITRSDVLDFLSSRGSR